MKSRKRKLIKSGRKMYDITNHDKFMQARKAAQDYWMDSFIGALHAVISEMSEEDLMFDVLDKSVVVNTQKLLGYLDEQ